jgi:hypothetical protein
MDAHEFTLAAIKSLGMKATPSGLGLYLVEEDGAPEWICFDEKIGRERRATLYAPGSAAFSRLVDRMIATGVHQVQDVDDDPPRRSDEIGRAWIASFGATPLSTKVEEVRRCFEGNAPALSLVDAHHVFGPCGLRPSQKGHVRAASTICVASTFAWPTAGRESPHAPQHTRNPKIRPFHTPSRGTFAHSGAVTSDK